VPEFREVDVIRVDGGRSTPAADRVAEEAPLEVRLEGEPFAVIMRTPGADDDLAVGFLLTEGVIRGAADLRRIESDGPPGVINVRLSRDRAEILPEFLSGRRNVASNASCGMCGRRSLESLEMTGPPLAAAWTVSPEVVASLPPALRAAQPTFDETGGLHAAGLFTPAGVLEASAEDVGRHNAVDKLIGRMLRAGRLPLDRSLLCVSGRASFEIVQKAFAGRIPFVAAVSAASSLAVDLADETGITLVGFLRDGRFNVYANAGRVGI
jgi:FdhD protein